MLVQEADTQMAAPHRYLDSAVEEASPEVFDTLKQVVAQMRLSLQNKQDLRHFQTPEEVEGVTMAQGADR